MKRLIGAVVMIACASVASANLLVNGDFEAGDVGGPIPAWTEVVVSGFAQFLTADNLPSLHGKCAELADWNGFPAEAYIYQQVNVTPDSFFNVFVTFTGWSGGAEPRDWHHYGLGFDPTGGTDWEAASVVKAIGEGTPEWDPLMLALNGVQSQGSTVTVFLWTKMDDANAGWWAHGFDDATLTEVPEPGALLLLGTGLIGLVGLARRS